MGRSNLASKQPDEGGSQSSKQLLESDGNASRTAHAGVHKAGKQKDRLSEIQAEVERIGKIDIYVGTQRDEDLFTCLNQWCDLKICARVTTMDRLGLSKALNYYTQMNVKRRGDLLEVPAPVASIEIEQNGSPTDLFHSILGFLSNPIDCGPLRDLRSRTWGTLKSYGVKLLIVNHADLLSFAAFNELVRISEKLKISVVLAGQPYLNDVIDANSSRKQKYANIHNAFLKLHQFSVLRPPDTATVTQAWENKGLGWEKPMNLASDPAIVDYLHTMSQGLLKPLYDNLREVAVWKLDHPKAQINPQNIVVAIGHQYSALPKLKQI